MAEASEATIAPQTSSNQDVLPKPVDSPFHEPKAGADIILRSSDKVDFYVHKLILSLASPFFNNMFLLPEYAEAAESLAIVDVPEDSRTLDFILRSCYPFGMTPLTDLAGVRQVLEAAFKYEMDAVLRVAGPGLKTVVDEDPLGVFIVGWRCDREDVCRMAATRLLQCPLRTFDSEELRNISGYTYNKLVQWYLSCCAAASKVPPRREWFSACEVLTRNSGNCDRCMVREPGTYSASTFRSSDWYAHDSLWSYLKRAGEALLSCPSGVAITSDDVLGVWPELRCSRDLCRKMNIAKGRREFSELLGQEVDRVVSQVPMPKFCE
ncbi:hypothetical protein DENSPDRAFT_564860 [Dentipellis sp. KUC8613]|nr:hypothetical protein DENSPDRAFT_564860 [Dentipellis sp. KUC8613]